MSLEVTVVERFERGDPASPLGCEMRIYRDNRQICFIGFPNESNEDIQEAMEAMLREKFGVTIKRSHDADVDYYHHFPTRDY